MVIDIDAHRADVPTRDRILPGISIPESADLTGLADGFHTMAVLAELHDAVSPADDSATLRVRTPSGGLHVWYRVRPGRRMLSSTGSGTTRALAWQVDVRGVGGYIVLPGTVTADGDYTVEGQFTMPRPLPAWLAFELGRTGHLESSRPAREHTPVIPPRAGAAIARARAARGHRTPAARTVAKVLGEVLACAAVPEGAGFSEKLNRAAYTLGGLVAAGHVEAAEAEESLIAAAAVARPGQERRAQGIVRSGMAAGRQRPLHLEGRG